MSPTVLHMLGKRNRSKLLMMIRSLWSVDKNKKKWQNWDGLDNKSKVFVGILRSGFRRIIAFRPICPRVVTKGHAVMTRFLEGTSRHTEIYRDINDMVAPDTFMATKELSSS